jgi:hypothetical protein
LPIDHTVGVVDDRGGHSAAQKRLKNFLDASLPRYAEQASDPMKTPAAVCPLISNFPRQPVATITPLSPRARP